MERAITGVASLLDLWELDLVDGALRFRRRSHKRSSLVPRVIPASARRYVQ
jgi:hypothetical protein